MIRIKGVSNLEELKAKIVKNDDSSDNNNSEVTVNNNNNDTMTRGNNEKFPLITGVERKPNGRVIRLYRNPNNLVTVAFYPNRNGDTRHPLIGEIVKFVTTDRLKFIPVLVKNQNHLFTHTSKYMAGFVLKTDEKKTIVEVMPSMLSDFLFCCPKKFNEDIYVEKLKDLESLILADTSVYNYVKTLRYNKDYKFSNVILRVKFKEASDLIKPVIQLLDAFMFKARANRYYLNKVREGKTRPVVPAEYIYLGSDNGYELTSENNTGMPFEGEIPLDEGEEIPQEVLEQLKQLNESSNDNIDKTLESSDTAESSRG